MQVIHHDYSSSSLAPPVDETVIEQKGRKRKAPTLRERDWEPHKARIIELHVTNNLPIKEVREIMIAEAKFYAEIRQYRSRISGWGLDKNVKSNEMKAMVRKRQYRRLIETDKPDLRFKVRGVAVDPVKIDRWMRDHRVPDSMLYPADSEPSTPAGLSCCTVSIAGSPPINSNRGPTEVSSSPALAIDIDNDLPVDLTTDSVTVYNLVNATFYHLSGENTRLIFLAARVSCRIFDWRKENLEPFEAPEDPRDIQFTEFTTGSVRTYEWRYETSYHSRCILQTHRLEDLEVSTSPILYSQCFCFSANEVYYTTTTVDTHPSDNDEYLPTDNSDLRSYRFRLPTSILDDSRWFREAKEVNEHNKAPIPSQWPIYEFPYEVICLTMTRGLYSKIIGHRIMEVIWSRFMQSRETESPVSSTKHAGALSHCKLLTKLAIKMAPFMMKDINHAHPADHVLFLPLFSGPSIAQEYPADLLKFWLNIGVDIESRGDDWFETPLLATSTLRQPRDINYLKLLIANGANVHAINRRGFNALHMAAATLADYGRRTIELQKTKLVILMKAGCSPTLKDKFGETPSYYLGDRERRWAIWNAALAECGHPMEELPKYLQPKPTQII